MKKATSEITPRIFEEDDFSFTEKLNGQLSEELMLTIQRKLNFLMNHLPQGYFLQDAVSHGFLMNTRFLQFFRLNATDGLDVNDLKPENALFFIARQTNDPDGFIQRVKAIQECREEVRGDIISTSEGQILERDYIPIWNKGSLLGHLWQFYDVTQKKKAEQYALIQKDLGYKLAREVEMGPALGHVVTTLLEMEEIDLAGLYLFDEVGENLNLEMHSGIPQEIVPYVTRFSKSTIQFQTVQKGKPVFFDEEHKLFQQSPLWEKGNIFLLGVIPLFSDEEVIGSMNVASHQNQRLSSNFKLVLEDIAHHTSGAFARIKAQKNFFQSQRNFDGLFKNIEDLIFISDKEGHIFEVNPAVTELLGYPPEELTGKTILSLHPPEEREMISSRFREHIQGEIDIVPNHLTTKEGRLLPVEAKIVEGEWNGKPAYFGLARNISERLRMERKLNRSEARWQFALESSGDGIWDWNIPEDKAHISRQMADFWGLNDLLIMHSRMFLEDRIFPEDKKILHNRMEQLFEGESEKFQCDIRLCNGKGLFKWVLFRGKVLSRDNEGNPLRIIGVITDISARKGVEISLEKALLREKEVNKLKSQFVSMASHEFRTPLTAAIMAAETLDNYWSRMNTRQRAKKIERIKTNTLYLRDITDKMLNLSGLQSGNMPFHPQKTEINALMKEVLEKARQLSDGSHQFAYSPSVEPLAANIDPEMIKHVLNNVLTNSMKYSEAGSTIRVMTTSQNPSLFIEIADEGIGIPEGDQDLVFEPFQRAENVQKTRGTGLGLALSRQFVLKNGGDIAFTSRENEGTTFKITLPLVD